MCCFMQVLYVFSYVRLSGIHNKKTNYGTAFKLLSYITDSNLYCMMALKLIGIQQINKFHKISHNGMVTI